MENENMMMENEAVQETAAQETAGQEAAVQEAAAQPKKSRRQLRKEKKRARKQAIKQLRKDIRQRKKDEFRAKGCLGKIFWFFGKLIALIVVVALIATVVQVNFKPVVQFVLKYIAGNVVTDVDSVSEEELGKILPVDEQNAAAIDASAPIGEGETWAIYMYVVGSDLESHSHGQLSDATKYFAGISANNYAEESTKKNRGMLTDFMQDIMAQGMDLPLFFYEKNVTAEVPSWMMDAINSIGNFQLPDPNMASSDIYEMLEVKLPEGVKVVMQTGGAGNWKYEKINPNRTQRFVYDHEGMREVYNAQITSMARPETLSDFLRYCKDEHPADHTMVLFWNHGAGAFGYGVDDLFGGDRLTLSEMREAFEDVCVPNEENPPFDIIGFDACLMASMEVAGTFHGFADYLLGSEDVEPGYGWDYTAWLGALAENPQMNPLQLGKAITDSYIEYYARFGIANNQPATQLFSIIDLSKADDLEEAYGRVMARALDDSAEHAGTAAMLGKCAGRSIKYAGSSHAIFNTLDLGLFMKEAAAYYPEEANAVLELVDEMVLYNLACGIYAESTGITVYYPEAIESVDGILQALMYIDEIIDNEDTRALYYYKIAGCLRDDMQDYVEKMGYGEIATMNAQPLRDLTRAQVTIGEDQNYTVKAGKDAVELAQSLEYHLIQVMDDGTARRLGGDAFVGVNEQNDLYTEFEGKWLHIHDMPMPVKLLSATDNMVTCSAHVHWNYADADLLIGFDMKEETWTILGVQKREQSNSLGLAARYSEELKPGDSIAPVYEVYDMETGVGKEKKAESFTYMENTKVEDRALEDGKYISFITLTDARGDAYNLPTVSFEMKDGGMMNAEAGESRNTMAM